jgi:hypothetical protein
MAKNSKTPKSPQNPTLDALKKAAKGLQYTSETEADLEPFVWPGGKLDNKTVLSQAGAEAGTAVEEESLDDFLHSVPPEDKANRPRRDTRSRPARLATGVLLPGWWVRPCYSGNCPSGKRPNPALHLPGPHLGLSKFAAHRCGPGR